METKLEQLRMKRKQLRIDYLHCPDIRKAWGILRHRKATCEKVSRIQTILYLNEITENGNVAYQSFQIQAMPIFQNC